MKKQRRHQCYAVQQEIGQYVDDSANADEIMNHITEIARKTPIGGRLIFDFEGVKLIDPLLLSAVIEKLAKEADKGQGGIFRGRHVLVKNPNDSVLEQLRLFLRDRLKKVSVLVVYTGRHKPIDGSPYKVLNLPTFLEDTWRILKEKGPMRVRQVWDVLGQKGSTRERLRQLYKRGLIIREPQGDPTAGEVYFTYKIFTPEDE